MKRSTITLLMLAVAGVSACKKNQGKTESDYGTFWINDTTEAVSNVNFMGTIVTASDAGAANSVSIKFRERPTVSAVYDIVPNAGKASDADMIVMLHSRPYTSNGNGKKLKVTAGNGKMRLECSDVIFVNVFDGSAIKVSTDFFCNL